ncbi:MAG TPA: FAD-dependent oxidoreductase [Gammaproteobacteria bacterium]|jgi:3-phenylpropionate/trans-cinnamate dioxygenase ferredoxin reductase subunit
MPDHLVIVGGGQAAAQTIQTLRQDDFGGRITLIGREIALPYQRPPLSKKYFLGALARERLYIRPKEFYAEHDIALELGTRATGLDRRSQRLSLSDGREIAYDQLLLATGARVRELDVPGVTLPGVYYLRTLGDVDAILERLASSKRLVIIGAGYIGLEIAAAARSRGLEVTLLEAADRVMSRVVCEAVSSFYHDLHTEAGSEIQYAVDITSFEGRDRVTGVLTGDGCRFPCDLVIVGIGVLPETDLAAAAGLPCDNGIVVDEFARTVDTNVLAAGDCTNHPNALFGRRIRLESVSNAIEQGKTAAMSLLGRPQAYAQVPWFWSDQFDVKLQIAGLSANADRIALRGGAQQRSFAAYYLQSGRLVAVDAINSPRDFITGKRLIAARASLDPAIIEDSTADIEAAAEPAGPR